MNELKLAPEAAVPSAIPFKVRLEPYLIESICELSRVIREKGSAQTDVSGLLYGSADKGSRVVTALKTFPDAGPRSDLARRERLEKAYIAAVEEANEDPELSSLQLIGWFSFRNGSGLLSSDVVFHNQHFRKPEDLAIVIWREGTAQITAEVYSKSGQTSMTSSDYRWSSVRLSSEIRHMTEPIDLAMRVKLSDDSFLRAYSNEPDEPESVFDNLKKRTGETMSRMMGFFQVRPKQELYTARVRGLIGDGRLPAQGWDLAPAGPEAVPEPPARSDDWRLYDLAPRTAAPEPSRSAAAAASAGTVFGAPRQAEPQRLPELKTAAANLPPIPILDLGKIGQNPQRARAQAEVGGLPMVIRPQKKSVPWQWAAIIFIGCCAVVFAVLAFSGWQGGDNRVTEAVRSLFSGGDLNLRVRSEDERLRLMWNPHNPAVASATDGTLQILDGNQRRKIRLEGRQIADGSVFYRPLTNDVTFRLDVRGERATASGSVRVLDGPQGRQTPVLDVSDPAPTGTPVDQALNPLPPTTDPAYADPRMPDQATVTNTPVIVRRGVGGSEDVPVPVPSSSATPYPSTSARTPLTSLPDPNTIGTSPYTSHYEAGTASDRAVQAPSPLNEPSTVRGSQSLPPVNRTPSYTGGSTINGWDATPEPARKRRPAATTAAPANVADFVAPQPLLQVTPNTKSLANGAVTTTTRVEVQVRVDQTGHVAYARVLNGASVKRAVSAAALNAARQWTFQPATLRGQRVESDHTIVFEFRPQH